MRCEFLTHTLLVLTVLWRSLPPRSTPIVSLWSLCWHRQVQPERHPLRSLYTWLHTRCIGMPDSVYSELQDCTDPWACRRCLNDALPFADVSTENIPDLVLSSSDSSPAPPMHVSHSKLACISLHKLLKHLPQIGRT